MDYFLVFRYILMMQKNVRNKNYDLKNLYISYFPMHPIFFAAFFAQIS
jgi:hypothetical protein